MINDPKSAHFIAWTELGTSFVVSNVGEFSRSILGSHFKHNNASPRFPVPPAHLIANDFRLFQFSSFVRQLNMYGFHKINRVRRRDNHFVASSHPLPRLQEPSAHQQTHRLGSFRITNSCVAGQISSTRSSARHWSLIQQSNIVWNFQGR